MSEVHWHDSSTPCNCHNNPLGLPPAGPQWVRIEGVLRPDGIMMAWLRSDPNRPYTEEELAELRRQRDAEARVEPEDYGHTEPRIT